MAGLPSGDETKGIAILVELVDVFGGESRCAFSVAVDHEQKHLDQLTFSPRDCSL